jgi:hypothetical protein
MGWPRCVLAVWAAVAVVAMLAVAVGESDAGELERA